MYEKKSVLKVYGLKIQAAVPTEPMVHPIEQFNLLEANYFAHPSQPLKENMICEPVCMRCQIPNGWKILRRVSFQMRSSRKETHILRAF